MTGFVFILIGVLLLLHSMGIITIGSLHEFFEYWPIGLILVGIALILRMRVVASVFFALLILLFLLHGFHMIGFDRFEDREVHVIEDSITLNDGVESVLVDIDFGAGSLYVTESDREARIVYNVTTASDSKPDIEYVLEESVGTVTFDRTMGSISGTRIPEEWSIGLAKDVPIHLDTDYGASSTKFDLRNLRVETLDIDSGASSTVVMLGEYPTKARIDSGAGSFEIYVPRDYGVKFVVGGAAFGLDVEGLVKHDGAYYSENFDETLDFIEIDMDVGAGSVVVGFLDHDPI